VLTILVVVLLVVLIAATVPAYPYSRAWGPYPAGGLGLVLLVLLILLLLGVRL
jgi:hypothetical protein